MLNIAIVAASRVLLILLFLPFSALDKVLNFSQAVGQASQAIRSTRLSRLAILAGLFVEVVMSLGVVTGIADRAAAVMLAGYCAVTAVLWKQFWKTGDFRLTGQSRGRDTFWDFLKNFALCGGFLMLAFGGTARGVGEFLRDPLASSHPYAVRAAPDASASTMSPD